MSKEFQIRDGNLIASFDLENEDGDIDFCKLLKVSHGVADEIGMFVDHVATNKIIKDQSKQISDLEAKLAESEEQLLQKERIIEDLMLCEFVATTLDFNKLSADNCKLREQLAEHNQNKISFAVEQLEKMKETLLYDKNFYFSNWQQEISEVFDNQIKQLKEMSDE